MQSKDIPVVDVCGKRMLDYIIEIFSKFNGGATECTIRAVGRNISKGVEVAQIFNTRGFDIDIGSININKIEFENYWQNSCIEVTLKSNKQADDKKSYYRRDDLKRDFIEYPIYHILLDSLLHSRNQIDILTQNWMNLISINKSGWGFECQLHKSVMEKPEDERITFLHKLTEAYYRCGLLLSPVWEKVAKELSSTDDVIIGADTCILYDAALTEQLLNSLSLMGSRRFFHTPNWLLVVIPSAVMQELERSANIRDRKGFLLFKGRMGFRALQEILELNRAKDLTGISLIIVGESDPVVDARVELQGLRTDISYQFGKMVRKLEKLEAEEKDYIDREKADSQTLAKLSSGDMIIRDQFKQFLRQIDFHKGMYFITSDKTNSALAQTEGLHSIYYTKPPFFILQDSYEKPIRPKRIRYKIANSKQTGEITLGVPLGKLIYELAVGFGTITVRTDNEEIRIRCDGKGESLDYWLYKNLIIKKEDLQKLFDNYEQTGKFSLDKIKSVWDDINRPIG